MTNLLSLFFYYYSVNIIVRLDNTRDPGSSFAEEARTFLGQFSYHEDHVHSLGLYLHFKKKLYACMLNYDWKHSNNNKIKETKATTD